MTELSAWSAIIVTSSLALAVTMRPTKQPPAISFATLNFRAQT